MNISNSLLPLYISGRVYSNYYVLNNDNNNNNNNNSSFTGVNGEFVTMGKDRSFSFSTNSRARRGVQL